MLLGTPFRVFGLRLPEPVFPMVLAFAWAVIRPSMIAPFVLLALGLFLDLYWGGPFGLWALALLAAYAMVLLGVRSIMSGQSRLVLWGLVRGGRRRWPCGVGYLLTADRPGLPNPAVGVLAISRHKPALSVRAPLDRAL